MSLQRSLREIRWPLSCAVLVILLTSIASSCSRTSDSPTACAPVRPESIDIRIHRRIPHDATSYTQGLVVHGGMLYESSGRYGESRLSKVSLEDGSTVESAPLAPDVFAEGLALVDERELLQLTWKEGVAFRWHLNGLDSRSVPFGEFNYEGEGWGLTTLANERLVMSDGSDRLTERDPGTFETVETHRVMRIGGQADLLNELEWDGRYVWANRYQSDEILRIDPECWTVTGVVDGSELRSEAESLAARSGERIDVMNGIAHDSSKDRYLLTGKWWPVTFEVTLG